MWQYIFEDICIIFGRPLDYIWKIFLTIYRIEDISCLANIWLNYLQQCFYADKHWLQRCHKGYTNICQPKNFWEGSSCNWSTNVNFCPIFHQKMSNFFTLRGSVKGAAFENLGLKWGFLCPYHKYGKINLILGHLGSWGKVNNQYWVLF